MVAQHVLYFEVQLVVSTAGTHIALGQRCSFGLQKLRDSIHARIGTHIALCHSDEDVLLGKGRCHRGFPLSRTEVRGRKEFRVFNVEGDACHAATRLSCGVDAVCIYGVLLLQLPDKVYGSIKGRAGLTAIVGDGCSILRSQHEARMLLLFIVAGPHHSSQSLCQGGGHLTSCHAGIVHEEHQRIFLRCVIVFWDEQVILQRLPSGLILVGQLLELLDDLPESGRVGDSLVIAEVGHPTLCHSSASSSTWTSAWSALLAAWRLCIQVTCQTQHYQTQHHCCRLPHRCSHNIIGGV